MHPHLNVAVDAARRAGRVILRFMDQLDRIEIKEKSANDLVTSIDTAAEYEIIEALTKSYPEYAILGEESGLKQANSEYTWIIDPLDGTRNYAHGFPQFAVSIALQKHDEIEVSVVFDPVRNELFTAHKGSGAFLNNRRIRVSSTAKCEKALIGTGIPFRDEALLPDYLASFNRIVSDVADIRRAGSAALDLAYVAAGRLDGFWEASLQTWDIAAGYLLVNEAGGTLTNYKGQASYQQGSVIAGNLKIHNYLHGIISKSTGKLG